MPYAINKVPETRGGINEKAKSRKTIRGYRPKFSITKNLTFSGQKKLADIPEKIANRLVKTLKRIVPLKY